MKKNIMKKLLAVCFMSVLVPCGAFATMYVDHFTAPTPGQFLSKLGAGTISSSTTGLGASALFGTRYLENTVISGNGYQDIAINVYDPSIMSDATGYNVVGQTRIIWDGNTNTTLDYSAAPVDLSQGGQNNLIQILVMSNDLAGNNFTLTFGDGTTHKDVDFTLPANITTATTITLPFSLWSGVVFSNIRGAGLFYHGIANEDFAFDYIRATSVPEPSTLVLIGAGLIGAVIMKRRAKK